MCESVRMCQCLCVIIGMGGVDGTEGQGGGSKSKKDRERHHVRETEGFLESEEKKSRFIMF